LARTEKLQSISTAGLLAATALLTLVALWPAPARAQIFGRGARTEFISGFGIRTFASLLRFNDLLAAGSKIDDPAQRSISVRVTPVSLVYGLRRSVSVVGIFPFVDKEMSVSGADGPMTIATGTGIGDATFLVKWRFFTRNRGRGTFRLAVEGGAKTPTGNDGLRDADGALLPPVLQRGSGSWDPTAALTVTYAPPTDRGRWMFTGDVGTTIATEANEFEQGNRFAYDAMAKYRIHPARYPGRDTFLLLEINGRWQGRARSTGLQLADSGGHVVYLSPGIQFLLRGNLILEGGVQIPVLRDLNGTQLAPSFNGLVGLRYIIVP